MRGSRGSVFDPANVRLTGGSIGAGVQIAGVATAGGSLSQDFLAKNLTIAQLFDISAAGAGQIKFPATQNPSADANTLDDYEEGTWTPAVSIGGLVNNTTATYTKVGRLVFLTFDFTFPASASGSQATVTGLPFANGSESGASFGFRTLGAAVTDFELAFSSLFVNTWNGSAVSFATVAGSRFIGSASYRV